MANYAQRPSRKRHYHHAIGQWHLARLWEDDDQAAELHVVSGDVPPELVMARELARDASRGNRTWWSFRRGAGSADRLALAIVVIDDGQGNCLLRCGTVNSAMRARPPEAPGVEPAHV
jgi:hypothetical protein